MQHHRPARRRLLTRVAAAGVASLSLFAAGCSGGGGTTALPPAGGGVTSNGSGSGVPPATPTPTVKPSATPTPVATATPTPAATPTPVPTAAPTSTPSSGGNGFACSAAPVNLNQPYYADILLAGDVPANGGAFALNAQLSRWIEAKFVPSAPTPTPVPTTAPTDVPVPTPPPARPMFVYSGTYHIDSATAPTDGCFTLIATTDGSHLIGYPVSSEGIGYVNTPQTQVDTILLGSGKISAVALNLSPAALPANGTIALDDGDTGTISVQSVQTQQLPLSRVRSLMNRVQGHR
ncbi:MAG TPA: hypothetical protein VK665_18550 [Candidatus Elarobacter sp.]|nr:hypothetical protein [Candidatus Elarobacter sp.]